MTYQFYRSEGLVYRVPEPAIANVYQMEVWGDSHGWVPVTDTDTRADVVWYGTPLDADPHGSQDGPKRLATIYNMPTIADVSAPSLLKGVSIAFKPGQKKKRKFARKPRRYEHSLMSLKDIPETLDASVDLLKDAWATLLGDERNTRTVVSATMQHVAQYGLSQVQKEFLRQGLVVGSMPDDPVLDLKGAIDDLLADFHTDVRMAFADVQRRLQRRKQMPEKTKQKWCADFMEARITSLVSKYAHRAVNEGFARGRTFGLRTTLSRFDLARKKTDDFPIDLSEITIVQTAVLDANLCSECEEVHGETFEYGSDRQLELEPPYERCKGALGGNVCRCSQLAIIGKQAIDISEISEEELEDLIQDK